MESLDQVRQDHLGLHRHALIEGMLADVAIDDTLLTESPEVAVARVALAQGLVREFLVAVDDAPELGVLRLAVNRLVIEVNATRPVVVLQEIVGTGVVELLGEKTLASDGVPVAAPQLAAEYHRACFHAVGHRLQLVIASLDLGEERVRLFLLTQKKTGKLDPLRLSEWGSLLIAEIRHERDIHLFQHVVAAPFEGRDEDEVGIDAHDDLVIEVALDADLGGLARLDLVVDLLVEEMPCAGDADDPLRLIELDEAGELQ